MKNLTVVVVMSMISSIAFADTYVTNKIINNVAMGWGAEGVYVSVDSPDAPVEGCTNPRFLLPENHPLFNQNLALLIAGFHDKAKVDLYVTGCLNGAQKISAVAVHN